MQIPTFTNENIEPALRSNKPGDSFQQFIGELFGKESPEFTFSFSTSGKDGCIDHTILPKGKRVVIECKDTQGGIKEISRHWKELSDKLSKYLTANESAKKGQSQYEPWFDLENPITDFYFCSSSEVVNDSNLKRLEYEISSFFGRLPLRHLHKVKVKLLTWNNLRHRIEANSALAFRWFPSCRPNGLRPFTTTTKQSNSKSFRSYLEEHTLPYLKAEDEQYQPKHTLSKLEDSNSFYGCIITGVGGVGKTRYVLEVGRCALDNGWVVLQANNISRTNPIPKLLQRIDKKEKVLILFDYIESQTSFRDMISDINEANDHYQRYIRYAANCRSNYYSSIRDLDYHLKINLSSGKQEKRLQDFNKKIVRHILRINNIEINPDFIRICNETPILATFLAYLKNNERYLDISELRKDMSFTSWFIKRISCTFTNQEVETLPFFMAQYPLDKSNINSMVEQDSLSRYLRLHKQLQNDGWAIQTEDNEHQIVHDLFVDKYLSIQLDEEKDHTLYIQQTLRLAETLNTITSALQSLQRISSELNSTINWHEIIGNRMVKNPDQWYGVRRQIAITPLIPANQKIVLFLYYEEHWEDVLQEVEVQNGLGYLAEQIVKNELEFNELNQRRTFVSMLEKATTNISHSNYILNWSLRLEPEIFKEKAQEWINKHPTRFQSHYLMVAWLAVNLPVGEIVSSLQKWCDAHVSSSTQSFVLDAWMMATNNLHDVKKYVHNWLEYQNHYLLSEAMYIYKAWLNAGGELSFVKKHLRCWVNYEDEISSPQRIKLFIPLVNAYPNLLTKLELRDYYHHAYLWFIRHIKHPESIQIWHFIIEKQHILEGYIDKQKMIEAGLDYLKDKKNFEDVNWVYYWVSVINFILHSQIGDYRSRLDYLHSTGFEWIADPRRMFIGDWPSLYIYLSKNTDALKKSWFRELGFKYIIGVDSAESHKIAIFLLQSFNTDAPNDEFVEWLDSWFSNKKQVKTGFRFWILAHKVSQEAQSKSSSLQWIKIQRVLRKHKPTQLDTWDYISSRYPENKTVNGRILKYHTIKGGLNRPKRKGYIVDIGVNAFLSEEEASLKPLSRTESKRLLGETLEFEIIRLCENTFQIDLSRRTIIERNNKKHISALSVGEHLTGTVKVLLPYGVIIELGFVDALLHISEIPHLGTKNELDKIYKAGQEIEVEVINVQADQNRVGVSTRFVKPQYKG
ncbi:S1 RNA-binding domain-containing protein [Pseudoalteromonas luteoviolacea]|uniref:S1 RNA-binding domain-containing protein n=1 Tax=Pseudoalteromonas luteoviolacea TaxID=43657 RepID=UPI001B3769F0|nr:S1 RNA-binding domain-containing protein [Pseudoalteromonas luteoviolacea]MBQ4838114.1 30S ribosomal protein S1 [Pseudoalteromonas luteoviolacea]